MPLALAGLALGVVGTGMQIAGNAQSQRAINSTRAASVKRQKGFQDQANTVFNDSLDKSTPAGAATDINSGAAQRQALWEGLQKTTTPIASALPATGTSGSPTERAASRTATASNVWNRLVSGAQAREGGYGDWEAKQAIKNADAAQKLGVINNYSRGEASILPLEVEVASHRGDKLSGWGQIVSSLGMLTGMAGASGAFGSAAGAGAGSWNAATDAWTGAAGSSLMNVAPAGTIASAFTPAATSDWLSSLESIPVR